MKKIIFIMLVCLMFVSCSKTEPEPKTVSQQIKENSDLVFDSDTSDVWNSFIYFDSYEQTETKFIFFDKQGKYVGEAPITANYAIGRNMKKVVK